MTTHRIGLLLLLLLLAPPDARGAEDDLARGLVGHWPLSGDARDHSGNGLDATVEGPVDFDLDGPDGSPRGSAGFDGINSRLVVPGVELGESDLTVSAWVHTEESVDDLIGDLVSQYDPESRRGFQLAIKTSTGVTFSQANRRHLQFGIDDDRESDWRSEGRPGGERSILPFALASVDGTLYAGTCEPAAGDSGRVYRLGDDGDWIDCGAPDASNSVTALAEFDGHLFAGTGKYRVAGSSLPESPNTNPGGRIFRYEGGTDWVDCGRLPGVEAVSGLVVFRGTLHADPSTPRPASSGTRGGSIGPRSRFPMAAGSRRSGSSMITSTRPAMIAATSTGTTATAGPTSVRSAIRRRIPRPIPLRSTRGSCTSAPGGAAGSTGSTTRGDGPMSARTENGRYRDIARSLAGAREDTALIETVDRLIKAFPGQTSAGELDAVRAALVARRDALVRERTGLEETVNAAVEACEQGRAALAGLILPDDPEAAADVLADGAGKTLRRARCALDAAGKRAQPEDFHELRKCVKAHWMHVLLLRRFWPRPVKSRRKALDALGERLGELNDIFVMRRLIKSDGEALGSKVQLKLLSQLMKRSEKVLRKQCLREAELLFGEARKPIVRKIADRYQAGASESQPGINQ